MQCLEGEAIWEAAAEGRWSLALAEAALNVVDLNGKVLEMEALPPLRECVGKEAALFLIECADGFTCALLHTQGEGSLVNGWAYAASVAGEVSAMGYNANEPPNQTPFSYLVSTQGNPRHKQGS